MARHDDDDDDDDDFYGMLFRSFSVSLQLSCFLNSLRFFYAQGSLGKSHVSERQEKNQLKFFCATFLRGRNPLYLMYLRIRGVVKSEVKKYQTSPNLISNNQFRLYLFCCPLLIRFTLTFTQNERSFLNLEL